MNKINLTKTISFILVTKDRPDLALQAIDKIKNIITEKDELILVNGGKDDINHPLITKTIIGSRKRVPLSIVKNLGLNNFIKEKSIFSYAIPSPRIFNYTSFGLKYKSPLEKK